MVAIRDPLIRWLGGDGNAHTNLTFAFQNGKVKFAQQFFGSYALIQVFCFCSTNLTWFNSIIKYKNLSTNKCVWFNKTFSLYITKPFIAKKVATFIQPSIFSTQYLLKIKYFEEEPT